MKITAKLCRFELPSTGDIVGTGTISCEEPKMPPKRCYADADQAEAAKHDNPTEDPLKPFGDHPFGTYNVIDVRWSSSERERRLYGPVRLALDPVEGDALKAKEGGRTGLAIHGGPTRNGALRATFGCLRVDDETAEALAKAATDAIKSGRGVSYTCEEMK